MIDYLKEYGLSELDINSLKSFINDDTLFDFEIMKNAVIENLDYLKNIGVTNYKELLIKRPDICFLNLDYLIKLVNKYGKDLIAFTVNNAPDSLIQFEI